MTHNTIHVDNVRKNIMCLFKQILTTRITFDVLINVKSVQLPSHLYIIKIAFPTKF